MIRHVRSVALLVALSTGATVSCGNDSGVDDDTIAEATVRVRADGCGPRTELGTGT